MRVLVSTIPWLCPLLASCALDPATTTATSTQSAAGGAADVAPVLRFGADGSVETSAPLVAGAPATLHYDIERLPDCRAIYHGLPAWGIVASFTGDGGPVQTLDVTSGDATFVVPAGRDLAMWFEASDEYGCLQWDSVYGANYHFAVDAPPIVHFRARGFAIEVAGTPRAGDDVLIDYELARLAQCRQDYNGNATWDIVAHWRFDGGAVADGSVTAPATPGRVAVPLRVAAPAGSHELEIWFDNTDRTGCHAWDSDYGRNFHIPLAP